MAQILIRGVDDRIVQHWKAKAKANGRSLESELRELLAANVGTLDRQRAHEEILRIRASLRRTRKARSGPDSAEMVREVRDRWTR